jgi:hypothetical protein
MPKKVQFKLVPPVESKHIIDAYKKVLEDRERFGSIDVTVSVVSLFAKKLEPKKTLDITHRIFALATFLQTGAAKAWIMEETGEEFVLIHDALLRAAARAPLMEAEYIKDMAFSEDTFMRLVLEESQTEGRA